MAQTGPAAEPGDATGSNRSVERSGRLPRAERREQILAAATRAFARSGYQATSLDDIATQAGVSRMILYRHFDSKADLYRAVLDRVLQRLVDATDAPHFDQGSIEGLLAAATEDPDGFRLVFRHTSREPEFRERTDRFRESMFEVTQPYMAALIPDRHWASWASTLVPTAVIEAVIAWLDVGQPDPAQTSSRLLLVIRGIVDAARADEPSVR